MYFIFLILKEINIESDFQINLKKDFSKYSESVIFLVIIFNIISSVVRFLGSIFMLILAKLFYKINISK
jgi:hypothetical protein